MALVLSRFYYQIKEELDRMGMAVLGLTTNTPLKTCLAHTELAGYVCLFRRVITGKAGISGFKSS